MAVAVWELEAPARPPVRLQVIQGGRPPAQVYRRRRIVALGVLVVMFVALALLLRVGAAVLGSGPASSPEPRPVTSAVEFGGQDLVRGGTYVVQPGDTFWAIARAIQPTGDLDGLVHRLVHLNGGPELDVGEVVQLPA